MRYFTFKCCFLVYTLLGTFIISERKTQKSFSLILTGVPHIQSLPGSLLWVTCALVCDHKVPFQLTVTSNDGCLHGALHSPNEPRYSDWCGKEGLDIQDTGCTTSGTFGWSLLKKWIKRQWGCLNHLPYSFRNRMSSGDRKLILPYLRFFWLQ